MSLPVGTASATTLSLIGSDTDFSAFCAGIACEKAVAQARIGDVDRPNLTEIAAGLDTRSPTRFDEANLAWVNGQAQAFTLAVIGDTLSLTVGTTRTAFVIGETAFDAIYARLRTTAASSIALSSLAWNTGETVADIGDANRDGALVWRLAVPDGATSLSGLIALGWTGTAPRNSNLAVQFKLGDSPATAPVPLPTAAWLLLSGLAGLGWIGRRRRRH